jgi:hypothetical protein
MPIYYKKYDINPQFSTQPPNNHLLFGEITSLLLEENDYDEIKDIQEYINVDTVEITGESLTEIPEWIFKLYNLRNLIIYNCVNLTEIDIYDNYLQSITIVDCPNFTDMHFSAELPEFANFYCENCPKLTNIPHMIMVSEKLNYLKIIGCDIKEISEQLCNFSLLHTFIIENISSYPKLPNLNNCFSLKIQHTNIPQLKAINPLGGYKTLNWNTEQYKQFSQMIKNAGGNKRNTIITRNSFIDDNMLTRLKYNPIQNKYLIHYEYFDNTPYPIITIPRGTMLFSGRPFAGNNKAESFSYLYKLIASQPGSDQYIKHTNLDIHRQSNFQDALTYFFPLPFMTNAVRDNYKNIDIVTCSNDIRLLCLISPSPISRSIRINSVREDVIDSNGNHIYDKDDEPPSMYTCQDRNYDICLSEKLIYGLKLNGYIGIPYADSLTNHYSYIEGLMGNIDLQTTSLYKSCVFNESTHSSNYNEPKGSYLSGINSLHTLANYRTFGIPEIVLIPFDIHDKKLDYTKIYTDFMLSVDNNSPVINSDGFIFKPYHTEQGINTFETVKKIENFLHDNQSEFKKSLQSYPLFTGLTQEIDSSNNLFVDFDSTVNGTETMFPHSYETNGIKCKCAFETMLFYNILDNLFPINTMTGGKGEKLLTQGFNSLYKEPILNKTQNKTQTKETNAKEPILNKTQNITQTKETNYDNDEITKAFSKVIISNLTNDITIEKPGFYYSEKSGFPILCMSKPDEIKMQKINKKQEKTGGKKYNKPNKKNNKTNKKNNKKYNKPNKNNNKTTKKYNKKQ